MLLIEGLLLYCNFRCSVLAMKCPEHCKTRGLEEEVVVGVVSPTGGSEGTEVGGVATWTRRGEDDPVEAALSRFGGCRTVPQRWISVVSSQNMR